MKNIAILGSTGSIGTQTLDIIAEYPDMFRAEVLTAGSNVKLLAEQARKFRPSRVIIADRSKYEMLRQMLDGTGIIVESGPDALLEAGCGPETDIVVGALVGFAGMRPTLNAINAGKTIALANKETLVVAGAVMTGAARAKGVEILPVDSEHSAIFQCLQGEEKNKIRRIFLTASGGPFRMLPVEKMKDITVADALNHPNWKMGAKVTIDSASMMNKGFEMMEARWLFDCEPERIEVAVHPQSIVHSMVEFEDGSVKAQLGLPDMHLPIRYALGYAVSPQMRLPHTGRRLQLKDMSGLTFESPDLARFPLLGIAYDCMAEGGNAPCILNAANEVAVRSFLQCRIRFTDMPVIAEKTLGAIGRISDDELSLDALMQTHIEATDYAGSLVK